MITERREVSRNRQLSPLPDDLPLAVRALLGELRLLKDRSGYDLRALASKTHFSRSSWGRWLSGDTWIPREAVTSMAELCAGDTGELTALWQRAEDERQARKYAAATEVTRGTAPPSHRHTDGTAAADEPAVRPRRGRGMLAMAVAGTAVVAGTAGLLAGRSLGTTGSPAPAHPYTQWLTRQEVLARVRTWNPHTAQRLPYSQTAFREGYRTDGSGYASMALGLPTPGPLSTDLASGRYSRRIPADALLPGDLIINPTGDADTRQVAVFDAWADRPHARYWVYQQRRGYGTDHLVLGYALDGRGPYHAYRPLNIHEVGTG
jgi:hypothetical protein